MSSHSAEVSKILKLLEETPTQFAQLTTDLSEVQLHKAPQEGEWSATELLAHLRSCSDMWGKAIQVILTEDEPTIRAVNPTTWIHQTDYPKLDFHPSFQSYRQQRTELLAILHTLTPAQWDRSATVTGAGKPLRRTLYFYARWLAKHERTHIKQMKHIVATVG